MGMSEGQKLRTRMYLDNFKAKNGGCVICKKPISDFYFDPIQDGECNGLQMYGACVGHVMLSNSDDLIAKALKKLELSEKETENPRMVFVTFNEKDETIKYAE